MLRMFCVHHTVYGVTIRCYIHRVHVCVAITYHQHFCQNGQDLLCATTVSQGGTDTEIRVNFFFTMEKKILLLPLPGLEPSTFQS